MRKPPYPVGTEVVVDEIGSGGVPSYMIGVVYVVTKVNSSTVDVEPVGGGALIRITPIVFAPATPPPRPGRVITEQCTCPRCAP